MGSRKYRIHICTPEGDLDYESNIERYPTLPFPTLTDTMEVIGPVISEHYARETYISILNTMDMKFFRTIEFLVDGQPHLAVVKSVKQSLQPKN